MDKKLLDALNNLSFALEEIALALGDKKEGPKSATTEALQSGNLDKKIELIDKGVKKLLEDNKKILKNQETLISLSKSKQSEGDKVSQLSSPEQKKNIKDGVSMILMIAVGVLAIGAAFKLIGGIDFVSVIALSASLPLMALAFEKIAKMKDLSPKQMLSLVLVTLAMSTAIALSSYVLGMVKPVGALQLFTAIFIGAMFSAVSFSISGISRGLKDVSPSDAIKLSILAPLVLVGISYAISLSSGYLQNVSPVGFIQIITAIGIGIAFIPISYALPFIARGIKDINIGKIFMIPLVLVTMAGAIYASSQILQNVAIIDTNLLFNVVLQSIALSIIGISTSIAMGFVSKIPLETALKGGLILIIISGVIMTSSLILSQGDYGKYPDIGWSFGVGLSLTTFGLATVALGSVVMSGLGIAVLLAGVPAVLGVATTIVAVSNILSQGNYSTPNLLGWAVGTSLLYAAFTPILLILGAVGLASSVVSFFGPNPWEMAKNMMVEIASTIVEVSFELQKGSYVGGPTKEWAEGVGLAIGAFSPVYGMLMLNKVFEIFGGGVGPESFKTGIKTVAEGIVEVAKFLSENSAPFTNYPTREWAEGVGLAIGAFSPVYDMLVSNKILDIFGMGVSTDSLIDSIRMVSGGIVEAGKFFSNPENAAAFTGGPSKEWVEGVGGAIGAFMPALQYISDNTGIFSGDGKEAIKSGISAVCESITNSANYLSKGDFTKTIPSTWIESVSKSVRGYISLAKELEGKETGIGGIFSSILGLRKIADQYSQLAEGVGKLAVELEKIDTEKLLALKSLTGSIVLMSLMDSSQFESMMDSLESKAKIFVDVINELESGEKIEGGKGSKAAPSSIVKPSKPGTPSEKSIDDLFGIMTQVSAQLSSINKSSNNISKYVDQIKSGDLKLKK